MSTPRFWTDPVSGLSYPYGDKLPASHMNAYRVGWTEMDAAIEKQVVFNFPDAHNETDHVHIRNVWVPSSAWWVVAREPGGGAGNPYAQYGWPHQGALHAPSLVPPWEEGLTITDMCAFGDFVVMCGTPGASSNHKYRQSANGGDSWGSGHSAITSTTGVQTVCHHYTGSVTLFVSGADGGVIETSPTGATWTQRTSPTAAAFRSMASNGVIVVGIVAGMTDKCVTSADCVTWTERTMYTSAQWYDICWAPNQQRWVAAGMTGGLPVLNISSDGITWTEEADMHGVQTIGTPTSIKIVSTGNLLVMLADLYLYVSSDLGDYWRVARDFSGTAVTAMVDLATGLDESGRVNQLMAMGHSGTDVYFFGSHVGS